MFDYSSSREQQQCCDEEMVCPCGRQILHKLLLLVGKKQKYWASDTFFGEKNSCTRAFHSESICSNYLDFGPQARVMKTSPFGLDPHYQYFFVVANCPEKNLLRNYLWHRAHFLDRICVSRIAPRSFHPSHAFFVHTPFEMLSFDFFFELSKSTYPSYDSRLFVT
jgi:hypothetical protein